jgi:hypothetical protein
VYLQGIPKARYRSLIQGPGGALYAVVDEPPELWKLTPTGVTPKAAAPAPAPSAGQATTRGTAPAPAAVSDSASGPQADGESVADSSSGISTLSTAFAAVLALSACLGLVLEA